MLLCEWMDLMKNAKEHYKFSTKFIQKHQQKRGGYIQYAKIVGHLVDKEQAEPNQRWHFFESYLMRNLAEGKICLNASAEKIYNRLLCPELLLWIAEACGVEDGKVKDASKLAESIIDTNIKNSRNDAGKQIRGIISWELIEESLTKNNTK